MADRSAALFRASNLIALDYPLEASIASALRLCDEAVVVLHADSRDGTAIALQRLAQRYPGRIRLRVERWRWDRMWQERWWDWAAEMTDAEWLMYHDADEALHERDLPHVRALMADPDVKLICFRYLHFYGTPRYVTRAYYPHNTRLGRRSAGYRMRNWCTDEHPERPACHMVFGPEERDAHGYRGRGLAIAEGPMYHYGWCRDAQALAVAQAKEQDWYADGKAYADGTLPQVRPVKFGLAAKLASGGIYRFDGAHPAVMAEWFAQHKAAWAQLEAGL